MFIFLKGMKFCHLTWENLKLGRIEDFFYFHGRTSDEVLMGMERYSTLSRTGRHKVHSHHSSRSRRSDSAQFVFWFAVFCLVLINVGAEFNITLLKVKFIKIIPWLLPAFALFVARSWSRGIKVGLIILGLCCASFYLTAIRAEYLSNQSMGTHLTWAAILTPEFRQLDPLRVAILWVALPTIGISAAARSIRQSLR